MSGPRISVLGSCNLDVVAFVDRPPRLGETVLGRDLTTVPGGKGVNTAIAAARAGGRVGLIGAVGADPFGRAVREMLRESGVDAARVRETDVPTGTAHITVDADGHTAKVLVPGANGTLEALTDDDRAEIAAGRLLLTQLELPVGAVVDGLTAARRAGVRTVVSPARVPRLPEEVAAGADLLVAHEREAAELAADGAQSGPDSPEALLEALLRKVPEAVITLGPHGCVWGSRRTGPVRVPAPHTEVVDSTAGGDAFVGAFAVALAEGMPIVTALRRGVAAGTLAVGRPGGSSSLPGRAEIDALADELAEADLPQ
ncbi:MAG: ribokinase [Streptosporangiales bacterium]|nr:ribokinase [Streptosporangiales bacterium]